MPEEAITVNPNLETETAHIINGELKLCSYGFCQGSASLPLGDLTRILSIHVPRYKENRLTFLTIQYTVVKFNFS